ncbi:predicted protein [Histoplasma capsulatum G186AR]|uniref:Uncharacterized protein n=1 Tax=Ajellomyces capsulatus (strain G186AR / H82 / ATCC MYA-2454 / RMSCC 2432) TaxID=447093 RepID=C0NKG8_AJECG|nr:uncharacterized protein HCBG_03648 [Histoplasma capsulatum G186AR]EEH08359.1 predicted protein [Histoplasma capsulatum G186AR]
MRLGFRWAKIEMLCFLFSFSPCSAISGRHFVNRLEAAASSLGPSNFSPQVMKRLRTVNPHIEQPVASASRSNPRTEDYRVDMMQTDNRSLTVLFNSLAATISQRKCQRDNVIIAINNQNGKPTPHLIQIPHPRAPGPTIFAQDSPRIPPHLQAHRILLQDPEHHARPTQSNQPPAAREICHLYDKYNLKIETLQPILFRKGLLGRVEHRRLLNEKLTL